MRHKENNMKATNSSSEQERKKQPLYGPTGTSRAETAVFTTLGITALVAVVIAVASSLAPAESRKKPLAAVVTYVRSGRLDADLREPLVNVIHLLVPKLGASARPPGE